MRGDRSSWLVGVVLLLAAFAAYRNSLDAPFLFDDAPAIVSNPTIRHLWPPGPALSPPVDGGGVAGRPLVNLSLAVNYALGGLDVRGYHGLNLALHMLATLTLWGVLRRTWRRRPGGSELARESAPRGHARAHDELRVERADRLLSRDAEVWAAGTALLWTVHPLLTESVVCVVQRNEVMGGLFLLLALYGFIRSTGESAATGRWQTLAVLACLAGVASKEIVAAAPVLVLLYDRTFVTGTFRAAWQRRRRFYGALAGTWVLLAWLMWRNQQRGGTVGFGLGVSSWDYLLTQCRALALYLKLSFWPDPLVTDYGTGVVRNVGEIWARGLLILALLLATVAALRRRPALGFAGACFFVILAPSSSFVPLTTQTIAEHRMYLPLAAVIALAVAGLQALAGRWTAGVVLALAVALGVRTASRNEAYQDELVIWQGALAAEPDNARAQCALGTAYYQRGRLAEAVHHYELSLQLNDHPALTHYNLGLALEKLERSGEAAEQLATAVRLQPDFVQARAELGGLLFKLGRPAEAVGHFQSALAKAPDLVESWNGLGQALAALGRLPEAVAAYEKALALRPELTDLHFNLGLALAGLGRTTEAIAHYAEAVRLRPAQAEARLNLGILQAQAGRSDEALVNLREATRLKPDLAEAHANLGIVLAETGRVAEALPSYEEALRLRPDYPAAHYNLGNALVRQQRWAEAKRHFAEAVRLAPDFGAAREMLDRLQAMP